MCQLLSKHVEAFQKSNNAHALLHSLAHLMPKLFASSMNAEGDDTDTDPVNGFNFVYNTY